MDDANFAAHVAKVMELRAADREREGSPAAAVYRRVASDILGMWDVWANERISIAEAVALSGYTDRGLRAMLHQLGAEYFTRSTVPRKVGRRESGDEVGARAHGPGALARNVFRDADPLRRRLT